MPAPCGQGQVVSASADEVALLDADADEGRPRIVGSMSFRGWLSLPSCDRTPTEMTEDHGQGSVHSRCPSAPHPRAAGFKVKNGSLVCPMPRTTQHDPPQTRLPTVPVGTDKQPELPLYTPAPFQNPPTAPACSDHRPRLATVPLPGQGAARGILATLSWVVWEAACHGGNWCVSGLAVAGSHSKGV